MENKQNKKNKRVKLGDIASLTLLMHDTESKMNSESRDSILQAQITKLGRRLDELNRRKADRRGRKPKTRRKPNDT